MYVYARIRTSKHQRHKGGLCQRLRALCAVARPSYENGSVVFVVATPKESPGLYNASIDDTG
jgi:hypothetical protein